MDIQNVPVMIYLNPNDQKKINMFLFFIFFPFFLKKLQFIQIYTSHKIVELDMMQMMSFLLLKRSSVSWLESELMQPKFKKRKEKEKKKIDPIKYKTRSRKNEKDFLWFRNCFLSFVNFS